jgi:hypothetical protein
MNRRQFMGTSVSALAAGRVLGQTSAAPETKPVEVPAPRIIYYNNFASHLLCAYNPNMYYPELPYRWSDADWCALIDMLAGFGFNVFEFWLEPRLFCREGLESPVGQEFARQMNVVVGRAHENGLRCEMIACFATMGEKWRTLCPNLDSEWQELIFLWESWAKRFPEMDIFGIFPGDPGACSRNGCTAETYIDKSIELIARLREVSPQAGFEFNTWGPPFFGWGNIFMPPESQGEFIPEHQASAWTFSKDRADRAMNHLMARLDDFPADTAISINMGFNGDGNPKGDQDARPWAREIAKRRPILTWDFSLTEGENAVYPHYRFDRLFARRREEREAAPYQGGICLTMTPLLNQLSLYESAWSFRKPEGSPNELAADFFGQLFGPGGRELPSLYRLFECLPDWGCYDPVRMPRGEYCQQMTRLAEALEDLKGAVRDSMPFHPGPERYRQELLFFARLFQELTSPAPDYDALQKQYWQHVYAIYDRLPDHVDPRPRTNTARFIEHFRNWTT